jgi:hypothetical protein
VKYQAIKKLSGLEFWASDKTNPTAELLAHSTITQLRTHALRPGVDSRRVAQELLRTGVRPRTAKKWALRLLKEALPRAARLSGPRLVSRVWR